MECWCRIQHGRNFEKSLVKKRPYIVLEAQHLKSCAFRDCRPILRSGPFSTCSPLPGCHCQLPVSLSDPHSAPLLSLPASCFLLQALVTTQSPPQGSWILSPAPSPAPPPPPSIHLFLSLAPHIIVTGRGGHSAHSAYGLPFHYIELFHLYRICRIGKFMQTESRLVFARGCGTGAWKMIADGFRIFRVKKMFRN